MLAKDLISDVIPAIRTSDTGREALNMMDIFKVSHLPIVNHEEFLGLISDTDIYDSNMVEEPLGNHPLSHTSTYVYAESHIYEAIRVIHQGKLTLLPVLSYDNVFQGGIALPDLLQYFAKITAVDNPGGIIILEMALHDYSAHEIAYVVEANDAKLLSLYINTYQDSTRLDVTLKINKQDIAPVVQAFTRHGYSVKATFSRENAIEELNEDRFEAFMRYLDV